MQVSTFSSGRRQERRVQQRCSSLPPGLARLLDTMRDLHFGRIEELVVRNGDVVFEPPPCVVREIKFSGEQGPRPVRGLADFLLKAQVVELVALVENLQDGVIDVLEVKHGLPFRVFLTEVPPKNR